MAKQIDTLHAVAPPTTVVASGDTIVPKSKIVPKGFATSEAPKKVHTSFYKGKPIEAEEALKILARHRAGVVTLGDAWGILLFFIFVAVASGLAALVELLH